MNSESHGDNPNISQEPVGSAGLVMPVEGLAHTEEWVDCPSCRKRVKTKIRKVKGDNYDGWRWAFCLCGAPCFCCVTMMIPKWTKFHYSTEHRCPNTDVLVARNPGADGQAIQEPKCELVFRTVKYNEAVVPMRYQQSQYPE